MTTKESDVSTEPLHIRISDVIARHGEPPWAERLLSDGRNDAVLICNSPGQENDPHIHPDFVEWWIVLAGEMIWEIGDYPPVRATKGDVVMAPKKQRHAIRTVGTENSLRLGITSPASNHDTTGPALEHHQAVSGAGRPAQYGPHDNRLHAGEVRRAALGDIDPARRPQQREPDMSRSGYDEQRPLAPRLQRVVDDTGR